MQTPEMQTSAKVIAHSKCAKTGKEVVTFEIVYPRIILAEVNTHRILSKNSASSRAIPITKVIEQVRSAPAVPSHWGKNQPGMSAREELTGTALANVQGLWYEAALDASDHVEAMAEQGAHKQVANRLLEPFQWMKTVITGTEWDNFFHLRRHKDADPTFQELANVMWEALQASVPQKLKPGQWHTPYVWSGTHVETGEFVYFIIDKDGEQEFLTLEEALQVSSSCCAQVSYRTLDDTLEKAQMVYKRLVESKPVHASPFEHCATPMDTEFFCFDCQSYGEQWPEGVTHLDRKGQFWSGNFCGFIQHRQLIDGNTCWEYKEENNNE